MVFKYYVVFTFRMFWHWKLLNSISYAYQVSYTLCGTGYLESRAGATVEANQAASWDCTVLVPHFTEPFILFLFFIK
jgi:hypothetical protein